jgi:hypothetical protein
VSFEAELAFAGPEGRFDSLADGAEAAVAAWFVFAIGSEEVRAAVDHELLELTAGEVLVGDDDMAGDGMRSSISAATILPPMLAAASSQPIGIPSPEQIR